MDKEKESTHEKKPAELTTIDAEELMASPFPTRRFLVDGLISTGLTLLCGRAKTGKSWLVMRLCLCVAQGLPFLGHKCEKGDVLYLALEDQYARLKERMGRLTDACPLNLRFGVDAGTLGSSLTEQLSTYLSRYPETRLIVIDTLQKIRGGAGDKSGGSTYGADYADMAALKRLADEHGTAVLLVHHLRKAADSHDPFNEISGSSGLMGASDTAFILDRSYRGSGRARLLGTGRDMEDIQIEMTFTDCEWVVTEEYRGDAARQRQTAPIILYVIGYVRAHGSFRGTPTELVHWLDCEEIAPNKLTRILSGEGLEWLQMARIEYKTGRTKAGRWVELTPLPLPDDVAGDGGDDGDGVSTTVPADTLPSPAAKKSDEGADGKQAEKSGEAKQLTGDSDNDNGQEKRGVGDSSAASA